MPDLRKDLFKSVVTYLLVLVFGSIGLWIGKQLDLFKASLAKEVAVSSYTLFTIIFATAIITSFITYLYNNIKYQKLKKDSEIDELTGLLNNKALLQEFKKSIEWAQDEKKPLSIILFDIDNFKAINNDHLLKGGDDVMRQVGAYMQRDSRATDITIRQHLRGDEFVIITRNTTKDQARIAAERKRKEISDIDFQVNNNKLIRITVSCGIAEYSFGKDTTDTLLDKANKALLTAKDSGKNCSIVFREE